MAIAIGARLVQVCEDLCEELRRSVGLTLFRIELDRRPIPLVVTLRPAEAHSPDPRHDWMRPLPATLESVLTHEGRRVGILRLQDARRSGYSPEALDALQRILPPYSSLLARLLEEGQL